MLLPAPLHASPQPCPTLAPPRWCPLWASSPPHLGTCLSTAVSWLCSCRACRQLGFEAGEEFLASCKPDKLSQVTKPRGAGGSQGTRPAPSSPPHLSSQDGNAGDVWGCRTLFSLNPFELRPDPALNWRAPEGSCVLEKAHTFPACRQLPLRVSSFLGVMNIALTQETTALSRRYSCMCTGSYAGVWSSPFYPYSHKCALIRIGALTEGIVQIPCRLRGAWSGFAYCPLCLDFH